MAADNGTLVAITSLLSASIAGGITLISKYLDNKQKKSEQAMVIKTTYINKKIEAGQRFVNKNNILTHNRNLIRHYFCSLRSFNHNNNEVIEKYKLAENKLMEVTFSADNYIEFYFDISDFDKKAYALVDRINILMPSVEPDNIQCDSDNYDKNINEAISLIDELLNIYQEMNKKVREDLQQYVIL
ncbi:MAG: hypothetical protein EOP34_08570 [Rickettsiales bacterium]|nr:MAG: hypothetical protein EOP34_08570 [Rickettsiales bacterium]